MRRAIQFLLFILFISCKSQRQDTVAIPTDSTTNVAYNSDSIIPSVADSAVAGAYQGIFPCHDCEGIQQTILLDLDHTYAQEQIKWEKNAPVVRSTGAWRVVGNRLELYENKQQMAVFRINGDSLIASTIQQIAVTDSSRYRLSKRPFAGDRKVWKQKKMSGILFAGTGTEPFWSLEITENKINFNMADRKKPVTAYIGDMEQNNLGTTYYLVTDDEDWTVKILPFMCSDGMSDFVYRFKVEVHYKEATYHGCGLKL